MDALYTVYPYVLGYTAASVGTFAILENDPYGLEVQGFLFNAVASALAFLLSVALYVAIDTHAHWVLNLRDADAIHAFMDATGGSDAERTMAIIKSNHANRMLEWNLIRDNLDHVGHGAALFALNQLVFLCAKPFRRKTPARP